jgi:alkylhydroperoxidase family enzyme
MCEYNNVKYQCGQEKALMTNQFTPAIQQLIDAVLTSPGDTDTGLRRLVEARAAAFGGRAIDTITPGSGLPAAVGKYVDNIAIHAYRVTDADIEAMRRVGFSEDAIFEITLSAALGAGIARLERGLQAVRGDTDAP